MSLPTAHNYVIKNLVENLGSLEKCFLNPKLLREHLVETEKVLNEGIEIMTKSEFSKDTVGKEKGTIELLLKKINLLEKASKEKLNWVNEFSDYLQANAKTK